MIPGLGTLVGGGGFSGSSSATSTAKQGDVGVGGGFNFQPKGGNLPPVAWIAAAAVAGLIAVYFIARKR